MARAFVASLALALILVGCEENLSSRRNAVAFLGEPARSPKAARDFLSCLRREGIKVVIPRVAYAPDSARVVPDSPDLARYFFWVDEHPTKAAKTVTRTCAAITT